jgi:diaminopimelate decarboxylase
MSQEFTRIVIEIPSRTNLPLGALTESVESGFGWTSKHPSGMPLLAKRLRRNSVPQQSKAAEIPDSMLADLDALELCKIETPHRVLLAGTARGLFEHSARYIKHISIDCDLKLNAAYSIKTDPAMDLVGLANDMGMLAEVISQQEIEHALRAGFSLDRIVANGLDKSWAASSGTVLPKAIFCDSVEEFRMLSNGRYLPSILGIRVRPPFIPSRFGIVLDELIDFDNLVSAIQDAPVDCSLGIHFHTASSYIGVDAWWSVLESVVEWARRLEQNTPRHFSCLDIGGGWFPDDWTEILLPQLSNKLSKIKCILPYLEEVILEPGKALAQPTSALVVSVIEVRGTNDEKEVVVDGAISDLPQIDKFPHRILANDHYSGWRVLVRGNDQILGRICMENDILATSISLPPDIKVGDVLVICDAGAYDRSMSYDFGRGKHR